MLCSLSLQAMGVIALVVSALAGCMGNDQAVRIEGDTLSIPVPQNLRQIASLQSNQLEIQVRINGDVVRVLPVSDVDDIISTVVNMPADRSNEITVGWYAIIGSQKIILAEFTEIVIPGTTVLNVPDYNSTGAGFDEDDDGRSNLSEAMDNRNLLSQFDLEVPFLNSFGGPVTLITDDGIDIDTSGEPTENDEDSIFRLRHNGSQLIVYLCGKDQTLAGDNSADDGNGQYWHDDTVFIYLDGADSDNATYDQFDDFQFAFVRSTEQMIVSKGSTLFCPAGECVQFAFFQTSTECTYELNVVLPLDELNMALDSPIGFDIEIVDDDNGGLRDGSSAWIGFNDRSDENPSTFGTIRLN